MQHGVHRRSTRAALKLTLACGLVPSGCATTRDFNDPRRRVREGTAFTLQHRQVEVDAGVLGHDLSAAAGRVGVAAGFGRAAEVSANLAHGALGIVNLEGKYNFVDRPPKLPRWSFAARAGVLYTRPQWIWALPPEVRDTLGRDLHLVMVPMAFVTTWAPHEKLDVSLGLGYTHAAFAGQIDDEAIWFDGMAGLRAVTLSPHVNIYVEDRVAIFVGARQAVWAASLSDFVTTADVAPGVEAGVRSTDWTPVPVILASRYRLGVETQFDRTHLRVFITHGPLSRLTWGQAASFLPGVELYWRW